MKKQEQNRKPVRKGSAPYKKKQSGNYTHTRVKKDDRDPSSGSKPRTYAEARGKKDDKSFSSDSKPHTYSKARSKKDNTGFSSDSKPRTTATARGARDDKDPSSVSKTRTYTPGREKKESKPTSNIKKSNQNSADIRLNKYISHAGICSRREADKLIEAGLVTVNGVVISELGAKVKPDDDIRYHGERLGNEQKVYLVLNKPKDYITSMDDPHAKKTVMELISKACKERIYPVGRLDKNTTGVLLFTNDGDLTKKLTHPSFNKKKVYHVHLNKNLIHSDMNKIAEGLELEDGLVKVDAIAYASTENKREIGVEIHSGKNRIVRRIFENLDYKVVKLDRVYFAGLTKKNLPRGRWRFLTEKEIKMLKMNAFE